MPRTPPPPNPAARRPPQTKGVVRAIFAVTGVVDEVEDLILPGAFTRTLASRRVKSVWHHDWKEPVGTVLAIEEWMPRDPRFATIPGGSVWPQEAGALVATVQFNLRTSRGRDAYEQVKQWHENGEAAFSIGYKVVPGGASKRHDGVRIIHDLTLYEISPVLHGAHPLTRSLEVKAAAPADEELERKATWSAVELKAAESQVGRGAMVALKLAPDVAGQIAHPDGTAAQHLHITLANLGDAAALGGHPDDLRDIITPAVTGTAPLKGIIGGIGRFPDHGSGEPTWVPVDVPGLVELRQRIVDALRTSVYADKVDAKHGFTPHITLGYDLPDVSPVPSTPVAFDRITVVRGGDEFPVPLGQPEQPAPSAVAPPEPTAEVKSAAQIVLEAKSLHPANTTPERKSAAQIVLEAKFLPVLEPVMPPMPLSYEQLHTRLSDAVRQLWKDADSTGDCWACVEATYPDHVIATRHHDGTSVTYSIPYVVAGRDIDLGTATEVELTTVALPVAGNTHAVNGDEEIDARYVLPTAAVLDDATALIEVSDAGPEHLQHLKPKITQLLTTLAKKGLPMAETNVPSGSSLNLWDDEYDIVDGWDEDPDPEGVPTGNAPDDDYSDDPEEDAEPEVDSDASADQVRLDADEVKAALAALNL
ncbi:HK97 family phage prohead protease [Streptomyces sp. NPDC004267]|uniref:HK97 family phage prohead protease n=1 Tax=Streptomyces sp. NPDC004267 TaxID=3364694 RepID=UPI0036D0ED15